MRRLSVGADVDAPAQAVWEQIARFEHWPQWGTTIRAVETDADVVASDVTGRVRTIIGVWLPFEITDVVDGHSWTWNVAGRPATGHRVVPLDPTGCRVEFTVAWPLAPYALPMWLAVRRIAAIVEHQKEPR